MFNFTYVKSSDDIRAACYTKIRDLRAKVTERERRIANIREDNGITDQILIEVMRQARNAQQAAQFYSVTSNMSIDGAIKEETVTIGAGTVNQLLTEQDYVAAERGMVTKLEMVTRNLKDIVDEHGILRGHQLQQSELEYLGF